MQYVIYSSMNRPIYTAEIPDDTPLEIQRKMAVERANLQRANLQGANLQGANLRAANLQGANLRRANLQDADLQGAGLQYADLLGANLQGANLQGANLRAANLQDADLRRANLRGANLQEANLRAADLRGQKIIVGGLRSDGVPFMLLDLDGAGWKVAAGCRSGTVEEAAAHLPDDYAKGPQLRDESRQLINHMLRLAEIRWPATTPTL